MSCERRFGVRDADYRLRPRSGSHQIGGLPHLARDPPGPEDAELAGKIGLALKSLFADWWG